MYRQVLAHFDDKKYQCILWRECKNRPIETFQLNNVTYGIVSALFLAVQALQQLANGSNTTLNQSVKTY